VIVIDTSALLAILQKEPEANACISILDGEDHLLISAGTVAEALIVAGRRGIDDVLASIIDQLQLDIVSVTPEMARRVAAAYQRWGKGVHAASLNFGDCFAYALAERNDCPLLYVGGDFAKTDIRSALEGRAGG
jgi:ribonuclease VapC